MNRARLKELRDFLKDRISTRFNYRAWGTCSELAYFAEHSTDIRSDDYIGNECGTGACAAGYTVALFDGANAKCKSILSSDVEDRANQLLEIGGAVSRFLFMPWESSTLLSSFFNWYVTDLNYPSDSAVHRVMSAFVRESPNDVHWQRYFDFLQRQEAVARIDYLLSLEDSKLAREANFTFYSRSWLHCLTPIETWVVEQAERMQIGPVERSVR